MNTAPARTICVAIAHPLPLMQLGMLQALAAEAGIQARPRPAPGGDGGHTDVVVADYDTIMTLARTGTLPAGHRGRPRLAVLATEGREAEIRAALEAGVQGYLIAACPPAELARCIRALDAGGRYLSDAAARCLANCLVQERLTLRESMVLELVCHGLGNKAIASHLDIAQGTVKSHVKSIMEKLAVHNRTQAVTVAVKRGLIASAPGLADPAEPLGHVLRAPPARRWHAGARLAAGQTFA